DAGPLIDHAGIDRGGYQVEFGGVDGVIRQGLHRNSQADGPRSAAGTEEGIGQSYCGTTCRRGKGAADKVTQASDEGVEDGLPEDGSVVGRRSGSWWGDGDRLDVLRLFDGDVGGDCQRHSLTIDAVDEILDPPRQAVWIGRLCCTRHDRVNRLTKHI